MFLDTPEVYLGPALCRPKFKQSVPTFGARFRPVRRPAMKNSAASYAGIVPSLLARTAAVLGASTALFVSSCGSTVAERNAATQPAQTNEPHISGEPAGNNAHDISFGDTMTAYDQQGIDMSVSVPDRSANAAIVAFAAKCAATRQSDIVIMRALIVQWDQNSEARPGGQRMPMAGMVDRATVAKLTLLRGGEFDSLWLQSMISLDQGEIELANAELANGKNVDAVGLARRIIDARQGEIGQMKQMRDDRR